MSYCVSLNLKQFDTLPDWFSKDSAIFTVMTNFEPSNGLDCIQKRFRWKEYAQIPEIFH